MARNALLSQRVRERTLQFALSTGLEAPRGSIRMLLAAADQVVNVARVNVLRPAFLNGRDSTVPHGNLEFVLQDVDQVLDSLLTVASRI